METQPSQPPVLVTATPNDEIYWLTPFSGKKRLDRFNLSLGEIARLFPMLVCLITACFICSCSSQEGESVAKGGNTSASSSVAESLAEILNSLASNKDAMVQREITVDGPSGPAKEPPLSELGMAFVVPATADQVLQFKMYVQKAKNSITTNPAKRKKDAVDALGGINECLLANSVTPEFLSELKEISTKPRITIPHKIPVRQINPNNFKPGDIMVIGDVILAIRGTDMKIVPADDGKTFAINGEGKSDRDALEIKRWEYLLKLSEEKSQVTADFIRAKHGASLRTEQKELGKKAQDRSTTHEGYIRSYNRSVMVVTRTVQDKAQKDQQIRGLTAKMKNDPLLGPVFDQLVKNDYLTQTEKIRWQAIEMALRPSVHALRAEIPGLPKITVKPPTPVRFPSPKPSIQPIIPPPPGKLMVWTLEMNGNSIDRVYAGKHLQIIQRDFGKPDKVYGSWLVYEVEIFKKEPRRKQMDWGAVWFVVSNNVVQSIHVSANVLTTPGELAPGRKKVWTVNNTKQSVDRIFIGKPAATLLQIFGEPRSVTADRKRAGAQAWSYSGIIKLTNTGIWRKHFIIVNGVVADSDFRIIAF